MSKQLPPLNPLRTFEVAARSRTFTEAADELRVTQAAVSRQIGVLEGFFRTKLFERGIHSIRLTIAGQQLREKISPAFEIIHWASQQLLEESKSKPIRIQTYPTFAVNWLMPRLREFMIRYPDTNLRVQTDMLLDEFPECDIDLQIQLGTGSWENMSGHPLVRDEIGVVCSPQLMGERALESPTDFAEYTLLDSKYRPRDWADWLSGVGFSNFQLGRTLIFESSLLTYQAAVEGLGIAVGQLGLLRNELKARTLICPIDRPVRRDCHYWLIWPEHRQLNREMKNFVDWLVAYADAV